MTTTTDRTMIDALATVAREAAEGGYASALSALGRLETDGAMHGLVDAITLLLGRVEAREIRLEGLVTGTIRALVAAEDAKSQWTAGHSFRVAGLAVRVGQHLRLTRKRLRELHYAALLHDIGKIGTPERILENTTPQLAPEDFEEMKMHPVAGEEIVQKIGAEFKSIAHAIRHHHERWDGGGYPDGLAGESIPVLSRIIAVCDSYDAMRMNRPYQKGKSPQEIRGILENGRGRAWDALVVDALFAVLDAGAAG